MKNKRRRSTLVLILISVIVGIFLLTLGPVVINYIFIVEQRWLSPNLAFDAGNLLDYYGAVLGGLIACFAIVSAIHINNRNIREEREKQQFERAYETYHKLPDVLAKLDSAAVHLLYSTHVDENELLETLDTMDECETALSELHYINKKYYSGYIDTIIMKITESSAKCQELGEMLLREKRNAAEECGPPPSELIAVAKSLRQMIKNAKSAITDELRNLSFKNSEM